MNEIEIEHQCFCAENGMFCQFMDKAGYCIATDCQYVWDWIEQMRIDKEAAMSNEMCEAMLLLLNDKLEKED